MNGMRALFTATAIAAALALGACGGGGGSDDAARDVLRNTSYGQVQGSNDAVTSGTYAWKGVPFAQPPVGALRWRAPVEPEPWTQVRDATKFGHACLQLGRIYGPGANNTYDDSIAATLGQPVGNEDCLTLNIWRPANQDRNLPVIAFVYGGSNISGYSADPLYDGAALAKQANAVVVSMNYRVGALGFLNAAPLKTGTDADGDSGNFALLDIVQALRFVKHDIAEFGGDPARVTLMGQSAGAINIWALMTAPSAKGLFQRAAPISAGVSLASNLPAGKWPTLAPAVVYAAQGNALLGSLLIADGRAADAASAAAYAATQTPAQLAEYLRGKDGGTILSAVAALAPLGLAGSGPIPDGEFMPTDPIAAIRAGDYHRMPVLSGFTRDEGKLFAAVLPLLGGPPGFKMDDAQRFKLMADFDPDAPGTLTEADILDPAYAPSDTPVTGWTAKADLITELLFAPVRDDALDTLRTQQAEVWNYRFDWAQEPAPWNTIYGAAHAFDLPFLFGNFGPSVFANTIGGQVNQPGRLALSGAMMGSLASFARSGDPNHAGLGVKWEPWPNKLVFDASQTALNISVE